MSDNAIPIRPKIIERKRLNKEHVEQIERLLEEVRSGSVSAFAVFAIRPGCAMWISRSRMSPGDRMNVIAQMEYAKYLMLKDDDEES